MDSDQNLMRGLKLADFAIMFACFGLSALASSLLTGNEVEHIGDFLAMRISVANVMLLTVFPVVWYLLFSALGLYDDLLHSSVSTKAKDVLKATSIGTCIIVALTVPFSISFIDATFMMIFWASVSLMSFGIRYTMRILLLRYRSQEQNLSRVILVGVNSRAVRLARRLESSQDDACRVVGFIDDTTIHAVNFNTSGYRVVAGFSELADYLAQNTIDEVVLCLPVKSRADDIKAAVAICEEQGIAFGILRDLFRLNLSRSMVRQLDGQLVITVFPHSISSGQAAIKRTFDIVLSTVLIVLLSPVFLLAALSVRLTSPGAAIFTQERVGLNKAPIRVFKFRTMVVDAEQKLAELEHLNEASGPVFKLKSDPRITAVGGFLRKSSIDELPQLFNVLRGEMSLVGPRPLPFRDYEGFDKDWYRRRVSVRPGITGLWQVNGRDQSSFDNWVKQDLEYIDQWSIGLDAKIIFMTIPAILRGNGAV